jgi:hypothetical protein
MKGPESADMEVLIVQEILIVEFERENDPERGRKNGPEEAPHQPLLDDSIINEIAFARHELILSFQEYKISRESNLFEEKGTLRLPHFVDFA